MDTITPIALGQLHESPFNPRRTFTGMEELAANIIAEGCIHEPLLVRPRTGPGLGDDCPDSYEIVFGHRRYRAAELARMASVPCMVRAMTDEQARRAHDLRSTPGPLLAAAAHYGIDPASIAEPTPALAPAQTALTPAPAARATQSAKPVAKPRPPARRIVRTSAGQAGSAGKGQTDDAGLAGEQPATVGARA